MRPVLALLVLVACPSAAHRLDEYLQASIVSLAKDSVTVQMRLAPGVAVLPAVLSVIDADGEHAYAERVLRDVSLTVDGARQRPVLVSAQFPDRALLNEGMGEIQLEFRAKLDGGSSHRLILENRHQPAIGAYLVNCLVPADRGIHIVGQSRNYSQSVFQVDYTVAGSRIPVWLAAVAVLFCGRFLLSWRKTHPAYRLV